MTFALIMKTKIFILKSEYNLSCLMNFLEVFLLWTVVDYFVVCLKKSITKAINKTYI